jgi:hypothetical protein
VAICLIDTTLSASSRSGHSSSSRAKKAAPARSSDRGSAFSSQDSVACTPVSVNKHVLSLHLATLGKPLFHKAFLKQSLCVLKLRVALALVAAAAAAALVISFTCSFVTRRQPAATCSIFLFSLIDAHRML